MESKNIFIVNFFSRIPAMTRNIDKPAKYKILTYDFFNEDRSSKIQTLYLKNLYYK